MKRRLLCLTLLAPIFLGLPGCASRYSNDCNLAQQAAAVFVSSLAFAYGSMDRIAQDATGCNL
ncbi:hypothetical protein [Pseudomonas viridiflava]|uniref:hypothetical protein n=1 Tax=Pseudomonas viridiflava TaxID=33069 RepID=UPI0013CE670A|nr:hypothetical protein [Pseudomonas viridiflava]MBD8615606.1 hypothetical protein [Pseudomonas putida]